MSERELEEAIEALEEWKEDLSLDNIEQRHLNIVLNLAQQYLDCKGLPEEKDFRDLEFPNLMDYSKGFYDGFNEALHLCKLAMMKLN